MNRKMFLRGIGGTALSLAAAVPAERATRAAGRPKRARAIAMWDFSWLERRWPGAGYEDWDEALDGLAARGYDALRIDPYPHLLAAGPLKSWLLKPVWETQDWGAPTFVVVRVEPELHTFLRKCRDRKIKVALSTWFRQDEKDTRLTITGPEKMAQVWNATLDSIAKAGLLDTILYVDLCNEWPSPVWAPFLQPPLDWGRWDDPRAMAWMRTAIALVRSRYPELPLLFSTDGVDYELFASRDLGFVDAIEQHLWMVTQNDDEFYKHAGYNYEKFSEKGFHNVQFHAARLYAQRPRYWQTLLTDNIGQLAAAARAAKKPLMTTECWAIVDYKDWPLLPWDWVKEVCALGALAATATGQWVAIATSNFCGPQFRGMWRDVAWHQRLTNAIKSSPLDATVQEGRLWNRL